MPDTTSAVLLWLFVLNLGLAFGAGLYGHRIVVSRWINAMARLPIMRFRRPFLPPSR